ncbi:7-carboxy-7-deazaguanine synthase QueE [Methanobrevibacter sp. TMH8]|uniref:7-carboxy-7-deazaguanine synthase QueE n=1 Tax=Methanobrevibacter sp. TMH8 TaxID=2848611 RepID=UPI001CCE504C|nr:7-carboxy-7-deazaguanine synthase QueE [Methanobrevibacter sp. TMH8]MBZ9571408.1 7-carboxy-7-deazaguanine synthase QueE [Methanobrevibacter sp. TMH8]
MKAPIIEIFSSFQGEGLWIGRRQIFVRFAGCNLDCNYCDTPESRSSDNGISMTVDEVLEKIERLKTPDLHSISFTGGEPLLYSEFINQLVQKIDIKIMIETNGTLPNSFRNINKMDCVSLDIKLSEHFGKDTYESIFEKELDSVKLLIQQNTKLYCKLVVSPSTDLNVLRKITKRLSEEVKNNSIPIVIQPVSPIEQWKNSSNKLFTFSEVIGEYMEVLIIPQTHKLLNIE